MSTIPENNQWINTTRGKPPFKYDPDLMNCYEASITFDLPVYIPLPDNVYQVRANGRVAHIRLTRIGLQGELKEFLYDVLEKETHIPRETPLRVPLLRFDPFNQSQVTVMFKPTVEELKRVENPDLEELDPYTKSTIDSLLNASLQFVNKLLEVYQHVSGEASIGFLRPWDISRYDGGILPLSKEHPHQGLIISHIGLSRLIHASKNPFINDEHTKTISIQAAGKGIPSYYRLLISARYLYLMGDYSTSIIVSQSALEVFLQILLLEKGITDLPIAGKGRKKSIRSKGAGLKRLCNEGLKEVLGKNLYEIDTSLGKEVDEAREIRNEIIHDAKVASMREGDMSIRAFSGAIEQITQLLRKL